jgi:hypothetical protein
MDWDRAEDVVTAGLVVGLTLLATLYIGIPVGNAVEATLRNVIGVTDPQASEDRQAGRRPLSAAQQVHPRKTNQEPRPGWTIQRLDDGPSAPGPQDVEPLAP